MENVDKLLLQGIFFLVDKITSVPGHKEELLKDLKRALDSFDQGDENPMFTDEEYNIIRKHIPAYVERASILYKVNNATKKGNPVPSLDNKDKKKLITLLKDHIFYSCEDEVEENHYKELIFKLQYGVDLKKEGDPVPSLNNFTESERIIVLNILKRNARGFTTLLYDPEEEHIMSMAIRKLENGVETDKEQPKNLWQGPKKGFYSKETYKF